MIRKGTLALLLFVFFFCAITYVRMRPYQVRRLGNRCFLLTDGPETKSFRPNCHSEVRDAYGRVATYDTDAHGLRKNSAAPLAEQKVLMIGDSIVEGLALQPGQTLPAILEARLPGWSVLNAGLSGTSPTPQLFRARRLDEAYRPRVLLWQLAENDPMEEAYFQAIAQRDPSGAIRGFRLPEPWYGRIARLRELTRWNSLFSYPLFGAMIYTLDRFARAQEGRFDPCRIFSEIRSFADEKGLALLYFAVPPRGQAAGESRLAQLTGACPQLQPLVDLRPVLSRDDFFQEDDVHLTPEGSVAVAEALLPRVRELLPAGPPGLKGKRNGR